MVLLADVEGFAYKEIADIVGIPVGTVMSRLHRGRRRLQKELWDYAVASGYLDSLRGQQPSGTEAAARPAATG